MIWGCWVRGLHPVYSFPMCKSAGYMECKRNKWKCEEGGVGQYFQKGKVLVACLDGDKLKGNGKVSCCGVNGIAGVQVIERAKEGVAFC